MAEQTLDSGGGAAADDASRDDVDTGVGEQLFKAGVVNGETEVGDEEHVLRGLASGLLAGRAWRTGCARLALARLLGSTLGARRALALGDGALSGTLALLGLADLLALHIRVGIRYNKSLWHSTYVVLFLLLGHLYEQSCVAVALLTSNTIGLCLKFGADDFRGEVLVNFRA